ncbi:MAG: Tol-Pal system beta propeller repeat protein TolB [Alphaproteobacteria bacterium]|nr:Tol-Pal system beta propeller repeat protein TolB [Alphaproteobacteria bacterium]
MRNVHLFIVLLVTAFGAGVPAHAQLRVTVEGVNFQPMPIAVPDFDGASAPAKAVATQMADVIRADLAGSAIFRMIDQTAFIERDLDISLAPRFPDWTVIQAQALVVGNVVIDASGNMVTQFRLYDVFGSKELFAQQYTVPTTDNWRRVAHKVADDVYAQLTGEQGYFDSRIVFVSESGPVTDRRRRLAIMDQDGANAEHLLSGVNSVLTPRFSPSSQTIIYSAFVADARNPAITRLRVYLYDIETGRQEVLSEIERATNYAARFSPDGKSVVMSREKNGNSDIYAIELARRAETRLTTSPSVDTSPSYSPDGRSIVFTSDRGGSPQLYVMRADGGAMSCPNGGTETACRISFGEGNYTTPVWSPRGDWVAFTKQQSGRFFIGVIQPDGKGERLLTESYLDEGPTWSPNGRVISFFREAGPGAGPRLWSIDLTGRNLKRLPTPGDASDPAWSPLLR